MNTGKTLFAQLMDFLPWTTFTRIVERHGGRMSRSHSGSARLGSRYPRKTRTQLRVREKALRSSVDVLRPQTPSSGTS